MTFFNNLLYNHSKRYLYAECPLTVLVEEAWFRDVHATYKER